MKVLSLFIVLMVCCYGVQQDALNAIAAHIKKDSGTDCVAPDISAGKGYIMGSPGCGTFAASVVNGDVVYLELFGNSLKNVPKEITFLTALSYLDFHQNGLAEIPTEFGMLTTLIGLNVNQNSLKHIPTEFGKLTALTYLYLYRNELSDIPTEIGQLSLLTALMVDQNALTNVPTEIFKLNSLNRLYFHQNSLTEIPTEIGLLSSMRYLSIHGNYLTTLPSELASLTQLTYDTRFSNATHNYLSCDEFPYLPSKYCGAQNTCTSQDGQTCEAVPVCKMEDTKCMIQCSKGMYRTEDNYCQRCKNTTYGTNGVSCIRIENCVSSPTGQARPSCETCLPGFEAVDGVCFSCNVKEYSADGKACIPSTPVPNCKTYRKDMDACQECAEGQLVYGTCVEEGGAAVAFPVLASIIIFILVSVFI